MEQVYLGIDIGGTDIKGGAVDSSGFVLEEITISAEVGKGVDNVLVRISHLIKQLEKTVKKDHKLAGIGLGIPGQIDTDNNLLLNSPNLPDFKNIDLPSRLKQYVDLPIVWDNDANLAALGEFTYGAGRNVSEMMMITLGTGIGGGLILRSEIYDGAKGFGGEFGHFTINPQGPKCNCGNKGCVEAYAGTKGILRTFNKIVNDGTETIITPAQMDKLTPKLISQAAGKGDNAAIKTFRQVGFYLGVGLAGVVNLLNLEMIVVGGGIAKAGDLILQPTRNAVREYSLQDPGSFIKIVPAELGNKAGLIGAAHLAKKTVV